MAWAIKQTGPRTWEYSCYNSAYGAVVGTARTLDKAKIELAIAQADLLEEPLPNLVIAEMRANPKKYAVEYPDTPQQWKKRHGYKASSKAGEGECNPEG